MNSFDKKPVHRTKIVSKSIEKRIARGFSEDWFWAKENDQAKENEEIVVRTQHVNGIIQCDTTTLKNGFWYRCTYLYKEGEWESLKHHL